MREIDGLSYLELADSLDVTVPAVKSLLVRARVGLVEAQESRDADCGEIQRDLMASYDRGVKASGRARRHMRECGGCREYRQALRGVRRSFAALTPAGAGPLALLAKLIGAGGAGGGAAAAGGGGGGAVLAGGAATATACKVAAVVCATAITAGGAVEVRKLTLEPSPKRERVASATAAHGGRPAGDPRGSGLRAPARARSDPIRPRARGTGRSAARAHPAPAGAGRLEQPDHSASARGRPGDRERRVAGGGRRRAATLLRRHSGTRGRAHRTGTAGEPAAGAIPADGSAPADEAQLPGADAPAAETSPAPASEAHPDGPGAPPAEH